MNEVVAGVLRLLVQVVVVVVGLVLFLSLLAAVLVLALVWAVRSGWARLTGRPITPWVMRMDPRTAFRAAGRWSSAGHRAPQAPRADEAAAAHRGGVLPGAAEVTDVEARELR